MKQALHPSLSASALPLPQRMRPLPHNQKRDKPTPNNMFHYDITAEDHRIVATSTDGHNYQVLLMDHFSGKTATISLDAEKLGFLVAFQLAPDGVPPHCEKGYELLEPIFATLPSELRLIP